jgi:hypothetical protein
MNTTQRVFSFLLVTGLCVSISTAQGGGQRGQAAPPQQQPAVSPSVWAAPAQPQAQATSAFQSACGSQPMCYDAPDFAVAVVDFRMSMASGYKLMDATLRFVNKTNQPLILGYLDGSAVALDDQGNRYVPYGNRGLAGIGLVNGATADPKFVLQPGGAGDARWELLWRPGAQDPIGSAFDLSMTIREVTTLVGGQHALGGEIPLRFQGLANGVIGSAVAASAAPVVGTAGVAGASPMLANGTTGLPPCGPSVNAAGTMNAIAGAANSVGGQQTTNATNTATNTASNAMAQLAGLKSIFGKKNAAAPANNVAGAANCIPAATAPAMPVAAGTSTAPAAAGQVVHAAPTATAPGAAIVSTPAAAAAAVANAKTPTSAVAARNAVVPATGRGIVQPNAVKAAVAAPAGPANAGQAPPAPNNAAAKPAVVNTAVPSTKPATQPATATAPTRKAATPPPPAKKPATTTAAPTANPTSK